MIAIPAVDVREGAAVQLVGGDYAHERLRRGEPLVVAREWREAGFAALHVVDLDAATGRGHNSALLEKLIAEGGSDVQVGGGLRDERALARVFAAGAARAVVGTRAVEDPAWLTAMAALFPLRLVVALDALAGRVVTRGWADGTAQTVEDSLARLAGLPLAGVLVTSVEREGRLGGPDVDLVARLVARTSFPIHASGGITTPGDLRALAARGAAAAVLGMALYTGALDARAVAKEFAAWPR